MKLIVTLLVLISFQLSLHAQEIEFTPEEQEWIDNHPVVYYGYDNAWKPIEFDEDGQHKGIASDYCTLLSERIGFKLEPHPEAKSWTQSLDLFKSGDALVLTALGENEERREYMNFTTPYQIYSWVIVNEKDGQFIGSIKDLEGLKVACPEGYFITQLLEDEEVNFEIVYTKGVEESLMAITSGKADATVSNLAVISYYLNYKGYQNLKIAAPADYPDLETRFGVSKEEPLLRDILNKGLETVTHKEEHEIVQNWVSVKFDHGVDMAKVWTIAGVSLGVVALIFFFIMYWNRKLKKEVSRRKEAEEGLQESFEEISMQKIVIEHKNEEVMDSIKYAKRLQDAILPSLDDIDKHIPNNFVLYLPKDIVAGDFYWMEKVKNKVFFAAADCTGHGVPGAMVSVVCSNALNRAVLEYGMTEPGTILDKTTDLVIDRFAKSEDEVKDGMDIGLASIEFLKNENAKIEYAGAHNHLWVLSKRADLGIETQSYQMEDEGYVLHEIKANKQPVGQYFARKAFETRSLELQKGERFYLYSDGFADQFGGHNGKKFKNKSFKNLLLTSMNMGLEQQKQELEKIFHEWKSDFEQLDDVCVLGVEV
jgi:ABC-type amino acid transport substrate-binding protein